MIIKLMSLLDIITAIVMILYQYDVTNTRLLISFIAYLALKAVMFRGDFASFIDACIAIYMVLMIIYAIPIITWIAAIYLIQKAITGIIL